MPVIRFHVTNYFRAVGVDGISLCEVQLAIMFVPKYIYYYLEDFF
jgi:hypothetical protein